MTTLQVLFCPDCLMDQPFERPGCGDGHGADCIELCCVGCGAAVLMGALVDAVDDEHLAKVIAFPVRHAA
jgi:hypothetical protein